MSAETPSRKGADWPSRLLGTSKLAFVAGLLLVGVGVLLEARTLAWAGALPVLAALLANLVVKVSHYRTVEMTPAQRTRIVASWGLLVLSSCGLVLTGLRMQFGDRGGRFFWPLLLVTLVLVLLHRVFRGLYHPDSPGAE